MAEQVFTLSDEGVEGTDETVTLVATRRYASRKLEAGSSRRRE